MRRAPHIQERTIRLRKPSLLACGSSFCTQNKSFENVENWEKFKLPIIGDGAGETSFPNLRAADAGELGVGDGPGGYSPEELE